METPFTRLSNEVVAAVEEEEDVVVISNVE
jgi:hypothetical protein